MDCLSREQMLLLQHNLTYETYEEFMSMFKKEERLPDNHVPFGFLVGCHNARSCNFDD